MEGEGNGNETFSNLISLKFPLSVEKGHHTIRGKVRLNMVCLAVERGELLKAKLGREADVFRDRDNFKSKSQNNFLHLMSNCKGKDKTVC